MDDSHNRPPATQHLRKLGGQDPARSSGNFLIEINEALRPMEDLVAALEATMASPKDARADLTYRLAAEADRAQRRIEMLVPGAEGIQVRRSIEAPESEAQLVVPKGVVGQLRKTVNALGAKRDMVAHVVETQGAEAVLESTAYAELRRSLTKTGLLLNIPNVMLTNLLEAYDSLKPADRDTTTHRAMLVPYLHEIADWTKTNGIHVDAGNPYGEKFIEALFEIAGHINEVRRNPSQIIRGEELDGAKLLAISHLPGDFVNDLQRAVALHGEQNKTPFNAILAQTTQVQKPLLNDFIASVNPAYQGMLTPRHPAKGSQVERRVREAALKQMGLTANELNGNKGRLH